MGSAACTLLIPRDVAGTDARAAAACDGRPDDRRPLGAAAQPKGIDRLDLVTPARTWAAAELAVPPTAAADRIPRRPPAGRAHARISAGGDVRLGRRPVRGADRGGPPAVARQHGGGADRLAGGRRDGGDVRPVRLQRHDRVSPAAHPPRVRRPPAGPAGVRGPRLGGGAGDVHPLVRHPPPASPALRPRRRPAFPAPARRRQACCRCSAACGTPTSAGASTPTGPTSPAPFPICWPTGPCSGSTSSTSPGSALGVVLPGALVGFWTHSWAGFVSGAVWGGFVRIFLMQHVTWSINSVCHVWGGRPFRSGDHSTNNFPIAIVSLGEGWHNNHHAFPTSARHGLRWWQFDASWLVIRAMKLAGLARNVRLPTDAAMQAKRPDRPSPLRENPPATPPVR